MIRRAGSASPEAISAERTRSRASDTALSGEADNVESWKSGRDLHLNIDDTSLDALKGHRGDVLNHVPSKILLRINSG